MTLTLEPPELSREEARTFLEKAKDVSATYDVANVFGHDNPRPPRRMFYDRGLVGTGTLAYYVDPQDVEMHYPAIGREIKRKLGPDPVVAYNPEIPRMEYKNPGFAKAVDDHEKGHGGQPGKMVLKGIYAMTSRGPLPLGEMIIEGGNEYALEQRRRKAPSRFMERMSDSRPVYSTFRDFAYELEENSPGVLRQIFRAAHRGGPNAAKRMIESIPNLENVVEKYASKLLKRYQKAA